MTAGGTREPIDPVRVLTNRSSGRQGHAIAEVAARRGAQVVLVTASPLALDPVLAPLVERRDVETAREMLDAVLDVAADADVVVMAAAVSDFRPPSAATHEAAPRRRRADDRARADRRRARRRRRQAARRPGRRRLRRRDRRRRSRAAARSSRRKGCDLLVVNDVSQPGAGFDHETNEVVILGDDGTEVHVELTSKQEVASVLLDSVCRRLAEGA